MIFVPEYWPIYAHIESRIFQYDTYYQVFKYQPKYQSMVRIMNTNDHEWVDTFYYKYIPGFGIAEWRYEEPQTNWWWKRIFGASKVMAYSKPINFGENVE